MLNKLFITCIWMLLALCTSSGFAQTIVSDGVGQTIQITTRFRSFVGRPSWLLMIRDVDHDTNIPYVFDFSSGENFWVALTYGRDYVVLASTLQIETYQPWCNSFRNFRIHNFCHLESLGRIQRGTSIFLTITGDLTPNSNTYHCSIQKYPDTHFVVVPDP